MKKRYKNNLKMRLTRYFLIYVGVHHTDDKIVPLTPPTIKEIIINQQQWQPVGAGGFSREWRGR
jgi:hypothetical protein